MFEPADEPSFSLDVAGLSAPFEVLAFTGSEALNEPFAFEIDVLIDDPHLDLAGLLHRAGFLRFGPPGNGVHGQLQSLVQQEHGQCFRLCRVRLGPRLSCLDLRFSQRMFSGRSVPQILAQVLKEHGISGPRLRFELLADYQARTFCTQYRESDLQFVQRLCGQERIHYRFEHGRTGHCLVFGDDPASLPRSGEAWFAEAGEALGVRRWQVQGEVRSSLRGEPSRVLQTAEGDTDLPALRSGHWLPLTGHPLSECNRGWLVTRVEHQGDHSREPVYANRVDGTQGDVPFVPLVRPRMHSLQRAWVVEVDEPLPDRSRPVAVQFDWLYQGEGAAPSHCWLPLAPALADVPLFALGDGVEVVVSFLEGDPDQPMISGVLRTPVPVEDVDDDDPVPLPQTLSSEGMPVFLQSAAPLLLLCLIPGGGSFSHCPPATCSCRLLAAVDPGPGR
ncbi:contractile injection system protein, VgrG/Pvc8 family [Pseudomonas sp. B2M1-30]|uniref:type VI secretion system Vgr family protein n=1 Tax=Pseudomonas TaxID=286 RepID=UPI0021C68838|nr:MULTISPECIES: contractile injection system protein, VgrG/Pvc8 family [Pseudomonas]MCU0117990.1 contractile injection system protein, VgrG/Pvc8 family [Pseudomonas sp. B2M1-30]MCU7263482.1 contractile injection system protein, VgrG/Pvc8 family [Pseudomonas koreensis]